MWSTTHTKGLFLVLIQDKLPRFEDTKAKTDEVINTKRNYLSIYYALLLSCLLLPGCDEPMIPEEFSGQVETAGEIPEDIWDQLDDATRSAIAEGTKYVALTFDDGPRSETTGRLLDGLRERGAQATFFVIGTQIQCTGNECLVKRMKEEGHQVGNHTYSHVRLQTADESTAIQEISKNKVILENILGEGEYWVRPPYGLIDSAKAKLAGTPMIYWSLDPEDWKFLDAEKVTALVVDQIKAGDIILLHDFYPSSVEAALKIIDQLQPQGYVFVTVEELFRIYGVTAERGVLYATPERVRPIC